MLSIISHKFAVQFNPDINPTYLDIGFQTIPNTIIWWGDSSGAIHSGNIKSWNDNHGILFARQLFENSKSKEMRQMIIAKGRIDTGTKRGSFIPLGDYQKCVDMMLDLMIKYPDISWWVYGNGKPVTAESWLENYQEDSMPMSDAQLQRMNLNNKPSFTQGIENQTGKP